MNSIGSFCCILKFSVPFFVFALISGCATPPPTPPGKISDYSLHQKGEGGEELHAKIGYVKQITGDIKLKVNPTDYPNGVFVIVKEMFGERPGASAFVSERLKEQGFKIADSKESADALIRVGSSTIDMKDLDRDGDSIDGRKLEGLVAEIGNAITTHGTSLFASDHSYLNDQAPMYESLSVSIIPARNEDKKINTYFTAVVSLDTRVKQRSRAFLDAMTMKWLDLHVRGEQVMASRDEISAPPSSSK